MCAATCKTAPFTGPRRPPSLKDLRFASVAVVPAFQAVTGASQRKEPLIVTAGKLLKTWFPEDGRVLASQVTVHLRDARDGSLPGVSVDNLTLKLATSAMRAPARAGTSTRASTSTSSRKSLDWDSSGRSAPSQPASTGFRTRPPSEAAAAPAADSTGWRGVHV
jgi:hypothetical protein